MSPFRRVVLPPEALAIRRDDLLSRPCEFFAGILNGRVPTPAEKSQIVERAISNLGASLVFTNDLYTVTVLECPPFIQLQIRRNDWGACKDWRDFQQIKNELVGVEHEAMELFPAESRLVDTANVYSIWVHGDPHFRFQVGLGHRLVTSDAVASETQRPLARGQSEATIDGACSVRWTGAGAEVCPQVRP